MNGNRAGLANDGGQTLVEQGPVTLALIAPEVIDRKDMDSNKNKALTLNNGRPKSRYV